MALPLLLRYFSSSVEAHCLLEGPLLRHAAQLFARHVVQELTALHHHSPHLLTALHLPGRRPETLRLEQLLDAGQQKVSPGPVATEPPPAAGALACMHACMHAIIGLAGCSVHGQGSRLPCCTANVAGGSQPAGRHQPWMPCRPTGRHRN